MTNFYRKISKREQALYSLVEYEGIGPYEIEYLKAEINKIVPASMKISTRQTGLLIKNQKKYIAFENKKDKTYLFIKSHS